jgi:murein DD-endopeptidase MepM/ murein hydrolase activator NlpD
MPAVRVRALALLSAASAAAGAAALGAVASADDRQRLQDLRSRIGHTQGRLDATRGRALVLTTDITALSGRIDQLQGDITRLREQQGTLERDLARKQRELGRTRAALRAAHARLTRLRLRLARAREILAERVVALYESDQPDLVSVVLDAHSFGELLETTHYLGRVGAEDRRIMDAVRAARTRTADAVIRLRALEARQRQLADAVAERRDEVAGVRLALEHRREGFARARAARARTLTRVRATASGLQDRLAGLHGEAASIERRLRAAMAPAAGGAVDGSGQLVWPVNGPITSPFCESRAWESCHPGIDIGVGAGTPIQAADAGRVVLAGPNGGYGNYTCIQHTASMTTCYAHQSSIGVHVGQGVSQGQVIGQVGCTGLCFGAHLHFEVRMNGSVTNPLGYL